MDVDASGRASDDEEKENDGQKLVEGLVVEGATRGLKRRRTCGCNQVRGGRHVNVVLGGGTGVQRVRVDRMKSRLADCRLCAKDWRPDGPEVVAASWRKQE